MPFPLHQACRVINNDDRQTDVYRRPWIGPGATRTETTMTARECLFKIYALHGRWAREFTLACEKGCAACCTQSVTMTTLEGELLNDFLTDHPELLPLLEAMPGNAPAPPTTINQFAAACLLGEYADEPLPALDLAPCVFLRDNCCTVYPARPFMCRSFGSKVRCDSSGAAEVEPFFLTLNTVILQCIEHLDLGRPWGNMYPVLSAIRRQTTNNGTEKIPGLLIAEQIQGFLIPPDEADRIHDFLQSLLAILRVAAVDQEKNKNDESGA
jgi:Fe-S-cluster containining protein